MKAPTKERTSAEAEAGEGSPTSTELDGPPPTIQNEPVTNWEMEKDSESQALDKKKHIPGAQLLDANGVSNKLGTDHLRLENLEIAEKMNICFGGTPQSSHLENYWGNEVDSWSAGGENADEVKNKEIDDTHSNDFWDLAMPHLFRVRNIPMTTFPGAHRVAGIDGSNVQGAGDDLDAGVDEQQHISTTVNDPPYPPLDLAVATAILGESNNNFLHAVEVDPAELERKRAVTKNQRMNFILCGLLLMIIVVVVAVLGVAFGLSSKVITATPTMIPSLGPSAMPSSAPSSFLALFLQDIPNSTLESIKIYSTPQWNAREWLQGHPELPVMPEWRKKQLFALATFYYAMEGPNWPKPIRDDWMLYDKSECFWFSNEFGEFVDGTIIWTEQSAYNITPCNERGEFHFLALAQLDLARYHPHIPPEISFLTSLFQMTLPFNGINSSLIEFLPSQIYQMPNLLHLILWRNHLSGEIPSQFGLMTNMVWLDLRTNSLSGPIPTEVGLMINITALNLAMNGLSGEIPSQFGLMTNVVFFDLSENALSGPIPTELGWMTSLEYLGLTSNGFSGEIPSQFGLTTNMLYFYLFDNALSGPIPTELGSMTNTSHLDLSSNGVSGEIPSQFGLMTNMELLRLKNNSLTGTMPAELDFLAVNESLISATFANNSLSGTFPAGLCSMGLWSEAFEMGLSFDCSDQLCGCCWCPCPGSYPSNDCQTQQFLSSSWPGMFPVPLNTTNVVIINIFSDDYPKETTLVWSMKGVPDVWHILVLNDPQEIRTLYSYTMHVVSNATYRLQVFDSYGDGICCGWNGHGWLTITNSTPSDDHTNGTVLWEALGKFESSLEVLLWIDPHGHAQQVEDVP